MILVYIIKCFESILKKIKALASILFVASLGLVALPSRAVAQSFSINPGDYKSPVAKKIASLVDDTPALKSYVQSFVNGSQASLMCKINVAPTWDMIMRQQAALEEYSQNMAKLEINAGPAGQQAVAEGFQTILGQMMKSLAVKLYRIDELC